MVVPLHVGIEHPNLVWLVVAAISAFVAGLGVNLYRSGRDDGPADESAAGDE